MKITKLEYQKKDPNRVNVYVDGNFTAGLDVNDILKLGIYNGMEIGRRELDKILAESEFGKLYSAALNFLSYRPRSEKEIRQKLTAKSLKLKAKEAVSGAERGKPVDRVIKRLKEIGQINDKEFAGWFIEQRNTFRPEGKRLLNYELTRKGVDRDVINQLLSESIKPTNNHSTEEKKARRALGKRLDHWDQNKLGYPKFREKVARFLLARGFDWETVKLVLAKLRRKE